MKFVLSMILCSGLANSCLDPLPITDVYYDDWQSCIVAGYEESIKKSNEVDTTDFNQYRLFLKFICQESEVGGISA
ncbi:hypothetical protein HTVC203P_gp35 [Pelagibacter phage HTVC203P]|nr:hypothetical protein HTVC203P_gp35 [Pelagibacter phage HTVC203P]